MELKLHTDNLLSPFKTVAEYHDYVRSLRDWGKEAFDVAGAILGDYRMDAEVFKNDGYDFEAVLAAVSNFAMIVSLCEYTLEHSGTDADAGRYACYYTGWIWAALAAREGVDELKENDDVMEMFMDNVGPPPIPWQIADLGTLQAAAHDLGKPNEYNGWFAKELGFEAMYAAATSLPSESVRSLEDMQTNPIVNVIVFGFPQKGLCVYKDGMVRTITQYGYVPRNTLISELLFAGVSSAKTVQGFLNDTFISAP